MKKTFILLASLLLCACGGQQNQNQQNAENTTASEVQKEVSAAEVTSLDHDAIMHKMKEFGYNYVYFKDLDGDGQKEIIAADYDPAEGGSIYGMGVFLNDKDLTCVTSYKEDRMDIGICDGMVVKMTLDDEGKENYEIFQIENSKATPAPKGTPVPEYTSLTSFYIDSWEGTDNF